MGHGLLDGLQLGILFNQGQVCCAGSRVFVQEGIYDQFVAAAVDAFQKVRVGDPLDPNTQMGSQINEGQLRKILSYIDIAKQEGATIACGGAPYTEGECAKGSFMQPTLITNVTNDMRVAQRKFSVLWRWSSSSRPRRRSSPWPTTLSMVWAVRYGPGI